MLKGKSEEELARLGECPLDPGGYFVVRVRGTAPRVQPRPTVLPQRFMAAIQMICVSSHCHDDERQNIVQI